MSIKSSADARRMLCILRYIVNLQLILTLRIQCQLKSIGEPPNPLWDMPYKNNCMPRLVSYFDGLAEGTANLPGGILRNIPQITPSAYDHCLLKVVGDYLAVSKHEISEKAPDSVFQT